MRMKSCKNVLWSGGGLVEVRYLGSAGQSDVSDCNGVIMTRKDKVICVNMILTYKQVLMHRIL